MTMSAVTTTTSITIMTMMNMNTIIMRTSAMILIAAVMTTIMITTNMTIIMTTMNHADDVFGSWGMETTHKFTAEELKEILAQLVNADEYGVVLRAKGIVKSVNDGEWLHFNYVPGESSVTTGAADYTGRFCVIGSKLQEHSLQELFLGE